MNLLETLMNDIYFLRSQSCCFDKQKEMKALMYFFQTELDRFINPNFYIDCRSSPQKLLRELRSLSASRALAKFFSSRTQNPLKLMRALTIANLLLIYSREWFEFIETHLTARLSKDEWLNSKFLAPYFHFLEKCCTSREQYLEACNLTMRRGQALQMLFYCVNMLRLLFKAVEKMPFLGRYYKQQYSATVCSAVETIAAQAQRLYGAFKHALTEILYRREEYIRTREDETIIRGILIQQLTFINEEMKKLFLDKYFYPLGKGIGVKLFKPQEQTQECEKAIRAIVNDHQDTEREKRHQQLERTLFPGSGLVNWNFYEETLLAGPNTNTTIAKGNESGFKDLDEIVLSEEEEQESPRKEETTSKEGKGAKEGRVEGVSGKETNSGTAQEKSNQF